MTVTISGTDGVSKVAANSVESGDIAAGAVGSAALASGAALANIGSGGVTQTYLATAVVPLGVGQTWQDVTASRAYGVTYTNSTGRAIALVISYYYNGTAGNVGRITIGGVVVQFGQTNAAYINTASGTAIVPAEATYVFTSDSGSNGIARWCELR